MGNVEFTCFYGADVDLGRQITITASQEADTIILRYDGNELITIPLIGFEDLCHELRMVSCSSLVWVKRVGAILFIYELLRCAHFTIAALE
jgi:hypothetical protein